MKKIGSNKNTIWIIIGIVISIASCIPYFINGTSSIITYHDQLDGELITYLLNAKYLFQNVDVYPEIMNGIPKNGLVSPAPAFILLYKWMTPFSAFMTSILIIRIVAFISMFLLLQGLVDEKGIAFAVAVVFMSFPFYGVYGLCIPGQPLLFYALLRLYRLPSMEGNRKWVKATAFCSLIVLYGVCSSLALVGFACIGFIFICSVIVFMNRKRKEALYLFGGMGVLMITYICCNIPLVLQILPIAESGFVSHKSELIIDSQPFVSVFMNIFFTGDVYANAFQICMIPVMIPACILGVIGFSKLGNKVTTLFTLIGINVAIAVWVALYQSEPVVRFRNNSSGILHDFNLARFSWLMPVFWCISLAIAMDIIVRSSQIKKIYSIVSYAAIVGTCFVTLATALYNGDMKANIMKLIKGNDYYMMTWEQFYAEDLFEKVDQLINRPKEDYRVVSLGIYPAAASYNGFYCLDAYSNNYDVEYKHEFRKIIAPQLDQSPYLTDWFDHWGNRCYIVLAEANNYFTMEKKWSPSSGNYELNFEQLKNMGCNYIISASYLIDSEVFGLHLLNEEPIVSDQSWYRLWVYEIE